MMRRVAITGLGLVSPYAPGEGLDDFFHRLCAGESAVRHLLTDDQPRPLNMPFVSCPDFDPDMALGKPLAVAIDAIVAPLKPARANTRSAAAAMVCSCVLICASCVIGCVKLAI